jgi:signal peptidase
MWHHVKQFCIALFVLMIALASIGMVAAHMRGDKLLSVQTGSMVPVLPKGTLVGITHVPTDKLRLGDIVTYMSPANPKITITHRIVELPNRANNYHFLTKGDANAVHDAPIPAAAILGKVDYHAPYVGYAADFLRKPIGLAIIIYLPALFIVYEEIRRLGNYYQKFKVYSLRDLYKPKRHHTSGVAIVAFVAVLGVLAAPVFAALQSQAVLTGNTILTKATTTTPPPSTGGSCSSNTNVVVNNSSSQTSTSGSTNVSGNTNGGSATSGTASNTNNTNISVNTTGC